MAARCPGGELRVDAESERDGNTAHSFENTRTVCHHAPRATHVDRPTARAHNTTCRSPPDSSRKYLPKGLNRSVPHAGITFALCLHERSACCAVGHAVGERRRSCRAGTQSRGGHVAQLQLSSSWESRSHRRFWLRGHPTPSSRADLLGDARESLTNQSVPPPRSTIERGLYCYDNQHVLAKLFGGWKGIHLAGGDFPAGAGFNVGVGYDHAIGSPISTPGSRTASRSRRAPPTARADTPASGRE